MRKRVFCHIWLHSALAWWMTQQENQADSARQRLCLPFAPYIHKSVIIAPVLTIYIFIHLSALVSKGRGWLLTYSSSFVCLVEVFTDVTSMWVKKNCAQVSSYVERTPSCSNTPLDPFFSACKQLARPPSKVLKVWQFGHPLQTCHVWHQSFIFAHTFNWSWYLPQRAVQERGLEQNHDYERKESGGPLSEETHAHAWCLRVSAGTLLAL